MTDAIATATEPQQAAPARGAGDFINIDDPVYRHYCETYQARTLSGQLLYLSAYLLPGAVAFLLVNVAPVHDTLAGLFGLGGHGYQYALFLIFTFGWHIVFPVAMLRFREGLGWREIARFLSLHRFSLKEIFLVAPIAFAACVLCSLPYMFTLYEPFQAWLNTVPAFRIPEHSIFGSYEAFYGAPAIVLGLMLVGNFVGEEIYFRGYLMKKTAFLGPVNWFAGSVLFGLYHLWQIPQTWPLIFPVLFFGLVMQLRKNLYTAIAFHLLFNLAGYQVFTFLLSLR